MGVSVPDSTRENQRDIQSAGTHYHQNQDDPLPMYTEYVAERPQTLTHPVPPRDKQRLALHHPQNGLENWYDNAVYDQDSTRQIRTFSQNLRKPIVIPATAASLGSPFLRAYPPCLEAFQIRREEFLDILDGLNRVAVKSPPLRALGLVGEVIETVPLATAQSVGLAINAAAKLGTFALSKGATEAYLRKINKEIFAPRGLKMEVAKLEAMARVNKLPILDAAGQIRSDAQLLQPLLNVQEIQTMGAAQRWLRALELWVEPLDMEALPPINMDTTNLWGRLHTMTSEYERNNSQKKTLKDRTKALDKYQKDIDDAEEKRAKELTKLEKKERKARDDSHGRKVDEKLLKIEQKREKAEMKHSNKIEKADEKSRTRDKEVKAMAKVLWLVIRNVHEDSGSRESMDISEERYSMASTS